MKRIITGGVCLAFGLAACGGGERADSLTTIAHQTMPQRPITTAIDGDSAFMAAIQPYMDDVLSTGELVGKAAEAIGDYDLDTAKFYTMAGEQAFDDLLDTAEDLPGADSELGAAMLASFRACREAMTYSGVALDSLDGDDLYEAGNKMRLCNELTSEASALVQA